MTQSKEVLFMPTIIPIKELRDTTKISETCHNTDEPIFITKNGYGDMVLMSMETYNAMTMQSEIDTSITKFENEVVSDTKFLNAQEALDGLRRKHLG